MDALPVVSYYMQQFTQDLRAGAKASFGRVFK